jgi:transposase
MSRRQLQPLRALTGEERAALTHVGRASSAPAAEVARARARLAVAGGASYSAAARQVGRRSGDAIAHLVARFNVAGLAAIAPRHGGGATPQYGVAERDRILAEWRRVPERAQDGTATWSLTTLQRALRRAPDGLPQVSTYPIWTGLHDAGVSWQRNRTWCHTGQALRRRTRGVATVTDPDAAAKKR